MGSNIDEFLYCFHVLQCTFNTQDQNYQKMYAIMNDIRSTLEAMQQQQCNESKNNKKR